MFKKYILLLAGTMLLTLLFVRSCDLEEEILDEYTDETVQSDPNLLPSILAVPLAQVRKYWYRERIWGFMETTTDDEGHTRRDTHPCDDTHVGKFEGDR